MYYITHGSEDSIDHDIYVIVDTPMEADTAKKLCEKFTPMNANLICIINGQVSWAYKGTIDECNNSIISTFNLHKQYIDCPITTPMNRSYGLKLLRTLRGLLSYCSRTEYREIIKKALKSSNILEKIFVLSQIDITSINDYKKNSLIEVYKFFAFQLGQTIALLNDNKELFTKSSIYEYYPDLKPYLLREKTDPKILKKYWDIFHILCSKNATIYENTNLSKITFFNTEIFDTQKELLLK